MLNIRWWSFGRTKWPTANAVQAELANYLMVLQSKVAVLSSKEKAMQKIVR